MTTKTYRDIIDELVATCKSGQGQIGANRVRKGIWNPHATNESIPEQHQINLVLARLSQADREVIAGVVAQSVVTGVFETLKVLEQFNIEPFTDGYEGSPYHDFIGRLNAWEWPDV